MVHRPEFRRLLPVACSLLAAAFIAAPPAGAQVTPTVPLPGPTTTVPAPPTTTPSSATTAPPAAKPGATTTTAAPKPAGRGVPPVPVGGPPTSTTAPGTPPPPPPDPKPILVQVDGDLAQLTAISEYKSAQALVAQAQGRVTGAGATLLSARQSVDAAKAAQSQAARGRSLADGKLRQMALAAYIGVGYSSPGISQPAQGNGDQGSGTVSTPGGLIGMSAIDAREMLSIVAEHAHQVADDAAMSVRTAAKVTHEAAATAVKDQAAVTAAEAQLLAAQHTLSVITTAAITPGAASATALPNLLSADPGRAPQAAPTTAAAGAAGAPRAAVQVAAPLPAVDPAKPTSPPILGPSALDASQLKAWWATLNRKPNITVPIDKLIDSYAAWGAKLGVRYDVALAQSIIETGYFSFPSYGQLTDKDNNFAGIGACDTCAHGWSFPTADTGVEAQLELLREYATDAPLPPGVQNVIGGTGVGGCCQTWTQLAGKWASSTVYGISIMTVYHRMLTWLIPQEEVSVGLIAPTSPAAKGPQLAPLAPGAKVPAKSGGPTTTTAPPPAGVSAAQAFKKG